MHKCYLVAVKYLGSCRLLVYALLMPLFNHLSALKKGSPSVTRSQERSRKYTGIKPLSGFSAQPRNVLHGLSHHSSVFGCFLRIFPLEHSSGGLSKCVYPGNAQFVLTYFTEITAQISRHVIGNIWKPLWLCKKLHETRSAFPGAGFFFFIVYRSQCIEQIMRGKRLIFFFFYYNRSWNYFRYLYFNVVWMHNFWQSIIWSLIHYFFIFSDHSIYTLQNYM